MKPIVQIEYSKRLLEERLAVLKQAGIAATGVLRPTSSWDLPIPADAVVLIGHRTLVEQRQMLISRLRHESPVRRIIALLGRSDPFLHDVDENCPADNPVQWLRLVVEHSALRHARKW